MTTDSEDDHADDDDDGLGRRSQTAMTMTGGDDDLGDDVGLKRR